MQRPICVSHSQPTSETCHTDETEALLPSPTTSKPIQKQAPESKSSGSVNLDVFLQYIRASAWSFFGLIIILLLFTISSANSLFVNWWLGRWANAERIRYRSQTVNESCSIADQSSISQMTLSEWYDTRNDYFYILFGKAIDDREQIRCSCKYRICLLESYSFIPAHIFLFLLVQYCDTQAP